MILKNSTIALILAVGVNFAFALENAPVSDFGSPGFSGNEGCYHSNYPEMSIWAEAGVKGGVKKIADIQAVLNPGENIQAAINNGGEGVILLRNGVYTLYETLNMRDGVVVRGESKSGVKISVKKQRGTSVLFGSNVSKAGLENVRLVYEALSSPPEEHRNYRGGYVDGNYCRQCFQNDKPNYDATLIRINGDNNWVDNVDIINSGSDPVEIYGNNNTFRNSLIDSAYNKGGGGEGYFDLRGDNNLIVGSTVRLIRHFSIQQGAKYNVIVENRVEVDINFHNKDDGHNLVENNTIIRPSWHSWGVFATGGARYGHTPPGPRNIIINNSAYDYRENKDEFSDKDVVYIYNGYGEPVSTSWPMPSCGKFYAVSKPATPTPPPNTGEPDIFDQCDTTAQCKNVFGNQATDCKNSGTNKSVCMCGSLACDSNVPPSSPADPITDEPEMFDQCDTTYQCKTIFGNRATDCKNSRSNNSICMCGTSVCGY
ncbi:hypothetical protein [Gilvimarinus chinensis]|uniref:hypothetical protein n=1 Tax=Gilvimarinus chinensis TaxID=396005 RepID=UPI0003647F54|nr:hypothetical protein [Gilvimarinus chinensis]